MFIVGLCVTYRFSLKLKTKQYKLRWMPFERMERLKFRREMKAKRQSKERLERPNRQNISVVLFLV